MNKNVGRGRDEKPDAINEPGPDKGQRQRIDTNRIDRIEREKLEKKTRRKAARGRQCGRDSARWKK